MAPDDRRRERSDYASRSSEVRRRSRERSSRHSEKDGHRTSRRGSDSDIDRPSRREESPRSERRRRRSPSYEEDSRRRRHNGRERPTSRDRRDDRRSRYKEDERQLTRRRDDSRSSRRHEDRSRERRKHHRSERSPSHESSSLRRRSPPPKRRRRSYSASRSRSPPTRKARGPLPSQLESFGRTTGDSSSSTAVENPIEKEKPNFSATGLLAKEANTVAGTSTVLKYHEPPESRKPPAEEAWRMFIFKGKETLDTVHLFQRSCWLMGRDQAVADLHLEHPSISKQHAVIQFRYMPKRNEFGDRLDTVKPYLIDLDSANGTRLNGKKIEGSRYVELRDADVVGFGDSEREYVLMLPPADD